MMIRITGLVAWYLLVGDVICGTMISGGVARITVAYPRKFLAHRILGWTLLAAVAVHIISILYQHYKGWGLWQVAVPSPAGPLGRDLGVVATWLLMVILVLAMGKKQIPKRQWHWIHRRVTFVLLALGTAHGLVAGSLSQGTQLPVIVPGAVALTLLASVGVVRANVTATHRHTRQAVHHRHVLEKASSTQRFWPKVGLVAAFHVKKGNHVSPPTRQERQARAVRIMFGLAATLGVSVLILGADQFGATGLRAFVTRQGGVGATPDTKDCGNLNVCNNPGIGGTPSKEVVAAPAHRHKSRKAKGSASSVHRRSTVSSGTVAAAQAAARASAESIHGSSTTTSTTTERNATLAARPAASSTLTPAIRQISSPSSTTSTTNATTTTTTTTPIEPTGATATPGTSPRLSPTASDRRTRPGEASLGRTVKATRGNDRPNNVSGEPDHAPGH
jgi:hypothetical protein